MPAFNTKWGEVVSRVLSAYPMGSPGLVLALESLCSTAQKEGEAIGRSKTAFDVCEGLHVEAPAGIKCLSCYHAETNYSGELVIQAEIDAENQRRKVEGAPQFDGDEIP